MIKVQNAFTYSLITKNILNSLKKEKLNKTLAYWCDKRRGEGEGVVVAGYCNDQNR